MVGIVLCRYQASMTGNLGLRKKGWWAVCENSLGVSLPTVSGDKVDKENIPP
jgi:hypothetical protein